MAYTKKELLTQLKRKYETLGRTPTKEEWLKDKTTCSPTAIDNHFGRWNAFLIAGKIPLNVITKNTKQKYAKDILKVAERTKGIVTYTVYKKKGKFHPEAIVKKFDKRWGGILEEVGLPTPPPPKNDKEIINTRLRWEVLRRDNFTCQYCGRSAPNVKLHVDHIISIKDGGKTEKSNLTTSCKSCNLGKGSDSIHFWGGDCGFC